MGPKEREAAGQLFALLHDVIQDICHYVLRSYESALQAEGLFHASYEHFLRALVRYDPSRGELEGYLRHALRARLKRYVQSSSTPSADTESRKEVPATTDFRRIDIVAITQELAEEGQLDRSEWDRLSRVP